MRSLVALFGVLALGILPGLIVAAGLSLVVLIKRLSRPEVAKLVRDPVSGAWGNADRHPEWADEPGVAVVGAEGPLFYANAVNVKDHVVALAHADAAPPTVVLDLSHNHDLDVETLDMLAELADTLAADGVELRLGGVHASVVDLLRRRGLVPRLRAEATLDLAAGLLAVSIDHWCSDLHAGG